MSLEWTYNFSGYWSGQIVLTTSSTPVSGTQYLVTAVSGTLTGSPTNNIPVTITSLLSTGAFHSNDNIVDSGAASSQYISGSNVVAFVDSNGSNYDFDLHPGSPAMGPFPAQPATFELRWPQGVGGGIPSASIAHSTPAAPILDSSSDTGSSNSDHITNASYLLILGTADAGDTIQLYRSTNGASQGSLVGAITANSQGNWTYTDSFLADGTYFYSATETGSIGGVSTRSSNLVVTEDTVAAFVGSVLTPSSGNYTTGQNLDFTINFSKVVTVDTTGGAPRIAITLNTGGTVYAQYLSGSGTNALVFRDTVQTGQQDLDGITVGMLDLNGGSIVDAAGNVAMTTLNSVGLTTGILVNTPVITTTNLVASTVSPIAGDTIILTATETDGSNTLTGAGGTATFSDGSTVLGTANVTNGIATFTTSALSAGAHNYSVLYSGDTFDQSSNFGISSPLVVTASAPVVPTPPTPSPPAPTSGTTTLGELSSVLTQHQSPINAFIDSTINRILALTTASTSNIHFDTAIDNTPAPTSTDLLFVAPTSTTPVTITNTAPVIIFQGNSGINTTLNNGVVVPSSAVGTIDRVVVGNSGNDHIQIGDATNTQVILGSGNNTVVGNGDNSIVQLSGNTNNYTVTSSNGHAIVTNNSTQSTTDISKIQYVQLDGSSALIFPKDSPQAAVTELYEATFGRTADHSGLQFWFDQAASGASLKQIANAFTQSTEFAPLAALSDAQFIQNLYQNTFGRAGEDSGVSYWESLLASGQTRADLITSFASVAASNIAGNSHTEAQLIGSVTIVANIV